MTCLLPALTHGVLLEVRSVAQSHYDGALDSQQACESICELVEEVLTHPQLSQRINQEERSLLRNIQVTVAQLGPFPRHETRAVGVADSFAMSGLAQLYGYGRGALRATPTHDQQVSL